MDPGPGKKARRQASFNSAAARDAAAVGATGVLVEVMTLDVRSTEVFVAVAEELHYGRAADRVYMTQPAVSRHINRLENGLGVMLFRRTNRH